MDESSKRLKDIAIKYFNEHPAEKAVVIQKGKRLFRTQIQSYHHWDYTYKGTICWVCGESWHNPELDYCKGFQQSVFEEPKELTLGGCPTQHIKDVLRKEEELYQKTISACRGIVLKRFKSMSEVTGADMAYLHTTHGCDPESLCAILDGEIPPALYKSYEEEMEKERNLSRSKIKQKIIKVKDLSDEAT